MSLRHSNPTQSRQDKGNRVWARAPYNFIPLPEEVITVAHPLSHDVYHAEGLTGWIDCELQTQSPTYVRGLMTELQFKVQGDKRPDALTVEEKLSWATFFSVTGETVEGYPSPVIPGSSLRGMIRTLVEIIGHGRMRWVAEEPTFTFRAVAASRDDPLRTPYDDALGRYGGNVKAGYLHQQGDDWYIQPAALPETLNLPGHGAYLKVKERQIQANAIPGFVRFDSPRYRPGYYPVSFEAEPRRGRRGPYTAVTRIGTPDAGYRHKGTLVCSGNMMETKQTSSSPRKNHALLLAADERAKRLRIQTQAVRDYLAGLTPFQKEQLWGGQNGCLKHEAPVFYVAEGNEVIYFGHSPHFRVPARLVGQDRAATPRDFVPDALQQEANPDLADAIFGWVEEEGMGLQKQCAGRVFFEDAHFLEAADGVWLKPQPITPRTLGSPKPTTFQHYLVQDREAGHNPDDKASLAHYGTPPDQTQIRGYKLYWHKGSNPDIEATASELQHETQLTRIVPLKPRVRFRFRVRFENLRQEELGALLWALTLPGEPDKTYYHKLGMGKPLGMGAVSIRPKLYLTDRRARYAHLFDENRWDESARPENIQHYLNAFETFLLRHLGLETKVQHLGELERIRMLLTMLEWREGDTAWLEQTRYMEIEHGLEKVNEYKERPVLPDPLAVVAGQPVRPPARQRDVATPTESTAGTRIGVVKKWLDDKGYGFITQADGSDIFVHHTGIEGSGRKSLRKGQRVRYTIGKGMRGRPQAQNVEPV